MFNRTLITAFISDEQIFKAQTKNKFSRQKLMRKVIKTNFFGEISLIFPHDGLISKS